MRNRVLKLVGFIVLLTCAVLLVRIFIKTREIHSDLSRQLQQNEARDAAHALIAKLLALEASDTFANPKLSAVEEMKAMIDRFQSYNSIAPTQPDRFEVFKAFQEASQRILKGGKKDVKNAEDELEKAREKALGTTVKS